jgi:hypothetical protein
LHDSAFYYRIQSPVILIEFDHQRPANLVKFAKDPKAPTQQHIHCVVRTPNGNDYGKDQTNPWFGRMGPGVLPNRIYNIVRQAQALGYQTPQQLMLDLVAR